MANKTCSGHGAEDCGLRVEMGRPGGVWLLGQNCQRAQRMLGVGGGLDMKHGHVRLVVKGEEVPLKHLAAASADLELGAEGEGQGGRHSRASNRHAVFPWFPEFDAVNCPILKWSIHSMRSSGQLRLH